MIERPWVYCRGETREFESALAHDVIAALERDVRGNRLRWNETRTRNVEELSTVIRGVKVTLEREGWALPEFEFASYNIRLQNGAGQSIDYVLGFLRPEVNHRLARLWPALSARATATGLRVART